MWAVGPRVIVLKVVLQCGVIRERLVCVGLPFVLSYCV